MRALTEKEKRRREKERREEKEREEVEVEGIGGAITSRELRSSEGGCILREGPREARCPKRGHAAVPLLCRCDPSTLSDYNTTIAPRQDRSEAQGSGEESEGGQKSLRNPAGRRSGCPICL